MSSTSSTFDGITVEAMFNMSAGDLDGLPFGVVGLSRDGLVRVYNATEARLAGLQVADVMGEPYFLGVAQCMNNFMVAQRFEDEPTMDAVLKYVLTLRMRPTPVLLRLLQSPSCPLRYILIERRESR